MPPMRAFAALLLQFDLGAGLFELGLDLFSLFLGDAFLHVLGRSLDEIASWAAMSEEERRAIMAILRARQTQAAKTKG